MEIDPFSTLGQIVRARPARARVLERLGLDYCCGGRRTLAEACGERGLDPNTVRVILAGDAEPVALESVDWGEATVAELCAHIVDVHHRRLRWELPRLSDLAARAHGAHGADLPELAEVQEVFESLRRELGRHIVDEEQDLFPRLVAGETPSPKELEELKREHDAAGAALHRLRELTHGYDHDRALCNVHRTLLDGLHGLELDLHQHVHEENNVLFVRARALVA